VKSKTSKLANPPLDSAGNFSTEHRELIDERSQDV
jgi:hypothetical protein